MTTCEEWNKYRFNLLRWLLLPERMSNTHQNGIWRFRITGTFFNNSAIVFKHIWPEKANLWHVETYIYFSKILFFIERTRSDYRQHGANPPPVEPRLTLSRTRRLGLVSLVFRICKETHHKMAYLIRTFWKRTEPKIVWRTVGFKGYFAFFKLIHAFASHIHYAITQKSTAYILEKSSS